MASSQFLFTRQWAVSIGTQGQTGSLYPNLHTTFDIEKTSISTSNKAKIALYNLNKTSRIKFVKGMFIQLQAGYQGLIETLYVGDIVRATSERKKGDIITTFECGDAERQLINAHFDGSYPAGVKVVQIIQDVAKALGVNVGTVIGIQDISYNAGFSASGSCKHILDRVLANMNLEWSIQNGYLQILPKKAHNGEEAIVISKETGMIGVPSQGTDCYTFDALLNPKLMPGQPVQIISETVNGFFKIRKAHFEGDTRGNKWNVKCEAVKIQAGQVYPQNAGFDFNTVAGQA